MPDSTVWVMTGYGKIGFYQEGTGTDPMVKAIVRTGKG
jgi:hypothetical protein